MDAPKKRNIPKGLEWLHSEMVAKKDDALLQNGPGKVTAKSAAIWAPILAVAGGGYGAVFHHIAKQPEARMMGLPYPKGSIKKWVGKGALIGAGAAGVTTGLDYLNNRKRLTGIKKYPKSHGLITPPGYGSEYPEHQAAHLIDQYFDRKFPTSREEPEGAASQVGRVVKSTAIGGLAGRSWAYHPVHGGPVNKATAIGAGIGAISQIAASHIGNAKVGRKGNKIETTEEARRSTRDLGAGLGTLGLLSGGIRAQVRASKFTAEMMAGQMAAGMAFRRPDGTVARSTMPERIAAKMQTRQNRILKGENLFIPRFGRRGGGGKTSDGRQISTDDFVTSKEDKLRRMAERGTGPEAASAKEALHRIRTREGRTVMGRVKQVGRSAISKIAGAFGKRVKVGPVAGLLH